MTNLLCEVKGSIKKIDAIYLWRDSKIVLHCLQMQPQKLMPFVDNRVSYIQDNANLHEWDHIRSEDNPVDIGS